MQKKIGKILKNGVLCIFFLGILYFFGKTIYTNIDAISQYNYDFNIFLLILSIGTYIFFYLLLTLLWKYLLPKNNIFFSEILYINTISWISKYLPGKVAMIVTKVFYLQEKGISKKMSFISCIYENLFQVIASFLISFPFIIYYFLGTKQDYYIFISIFVFIGSVIFLYPLVFNTILNIGLKVLKKEGIPKKDFLSFSSLLKYVIGYGVTTLIKGLSFLFLVISMTSVHGEHYGFIIFSWIFAGVIGMISIIVPNGLGVREGVLVLLLDIIFPLEISVIISVISRIWSSVIDGIIGLYIPYYKWKK